MNIDPKLLNEKEAVDRNSINDGTTPWKHRIIEFCASQEDGAVSKEALLKATDHKYDGTNLSKRSHCLASQLTYLRKDDGIVTKSLDNDRIVILGIEREDKVIPFKNAIKYL